MSSQPGVPQLIARNVYAAGAQTEPTVPPSRAAPWYSPRRSGSESSATSPQWPADWKSSAPVTVTWPEPDQHDRDPADRVVGDQHDQAGQHEEAGADPGGPQRARHGLRAARRRHLEQHGEHRVGAEQPGQQHPRGVGLLDQPQRDHDVEQHLVGARARRRRREREEAPVAQRARA